MKIDDPESLSVHPSDPLFEALQEAHRLTRFQNTDYFVWCLLVLTLIGCKVSACIMRLGRRCKDHVTIISRFTGENSLADKRVLECNGDLEFFTPRLLF